MCQLLDSCLHWLVSPVLFWLMHAEWVCELPDVLSLWGPPGGCRGAGASSREVVEGQVCKEHCLCDPITTHYLAGLLSHCLH